MSFPPYISDVSTPPPRSTMVTSSTTTIQVKVTDLPKTTHTYMFIATVLLVAGNVLVVNAALHFLCVATILNRIVTL
jgi:hypothetical protein